MTWDLAGISWKCYQRDRQQKKTDKLDFMKIKNFRASKGTINRVNREPTEQEKISASLKDLHVNRREFTELFSYKPSDM